MDDKAYIDQAIALAVSSVEDGGGPFAALVVKDGKVIGKGGNRVTKHNDPTAHAEVEAIRDACKTIGDFSLAGATLYASCEPCPMCMAASYWARVERIVFAASQEQAAEAGFDDSFIAKELVLPHEEKSISIHHLDSNSELPFKTWSEFATKTPY